MSRFCCLPIRTRTGSGPLVTGLSLSPQDVRALYSRTAGRDVDEPDTPVETGLDRILAHIRTHWEQLTERNRADTDGYLESKVRPGQRTSQTSRPLRPLTPSRPAGGAVRSQPSECGGAAGGGAEGRVQRRELQDPESPG